MANYGRKAIKTAEGIIVDAKTGEVIDENGYFVNEKLMKIKRDYYEMRKQQERKNLDYEKIDESFIWSYFKEQETLFPDLQPQDIIRLIYIATYCNFGNNVLTNNGLPMTRKDICDVMNISTTRFYEWFDKMEKYNYFECKEDSIIINRNFFNKGSLFKRHQATRLFINTIRNLYENTDTKDHYKLGYIFQLIPYINPYFNILAKNPHEKDIKNVKRFTIGDLSDIIGCSKRHQKKLANDLLSMTYGEDKTPIIALVALRSINIENMYILLNSKLAFGGNLKEYKAIEELFLENINNTEDVSYEQ